MKILSFLAKIELEYFEVNCGVLSNFDIRFSALFSSVHIWLRKLDTKLDGDKMLFKISTEPLQDSV